jgi:hypothetical protein
MKGQEMLFRIPSLPLWCSVVVIAALAANGRAAESVSLFDGKTLDGWDVIRCEAVVQDSAILIKSGNGLVQTKKQYADLLRAGTGMESPEVRSLGLRHLFSL